MRIRLLSFIIFAGLALAGGFSSVPVNAQCAGGGCGAGAGGAGAGPARGGGGCASGTCGSGRVGGGTPTARRNPNVGNPGRAAQQVAQPQWAQTTSAALERAATEELPIVIAFPGEGDNDTILSGEDMQELSRTRAVFVRIPFTSERELPPWAEAACMLPVAKLLSDNPSREYDIPVGRSTVIVADWHGNEHFRQTSNVQVRALEGFLDRVPSAVDQADRRLQRMFDRAESSWDNNSDRSSTLRSLKRVFDSGMVGLDSVVKSTELYHKIMDAAEDEIEELKGAGDISGLRALTRELRGTRVEKVLQDAIRAAN
jgi:hypothetical protein